MGKINNVLAMLKILEGGQKYSVQELADRLEVSKRMIKIYKNELEKAGIYVETIYGPYGGYIYNYKSNYDISFDYDDIYNIENILAKLTEHEKVNINVTLEKIKTLVIYAVDESENLKTNNTDIKNKYKILLNAINKKNHVEFVYHNKKRDFLPYTFSFYKDLIYITGFSFTDNDMRTFNLNKMKDFKEI